MAEKTQFDRVKEITDQLEAGIENLFNSDKYTQWLTTMSRFHDYSLNNTILIAMQKPDATLVAGYTSWQRQFGRQVNKGEKAIRILAPAPYKQNVEVDKTDPNTGEVLLNPDGTYQKEIQEIVRPAFKVVNVFDVSQTNGREIPSLGVDELTGEVEQFETFFEALKRSCPVPIDFEQIASGAKGYYHQTDHRIAIQEGMSQIQTVKTAIHEMAHQKLHAIDQDKDKVLSLHTMERQNLSKCHGRIKMRQILVQSYGHAAKRVVELRNGINIRRKVEINFLALQEVFHCFHGIGTVFLFRRAEAMRKTDLRIVGANLLPKHTQHSNVGHGITVNMQCTNLFRIMIDCQKHQKICLTTGTVALSYAAFRLVNTDNKNQIHVVLSHESPSFIINALISSDILVQHPALLLLLTVQTPYDDKQGRS